MAGGLPWPHADPGRACAQLPVQHTSHGGHAPGNHEVWNWSLPFMVLAVEQPIKDLAQRADVMQVVQDDDERHVHSIVLTGALVGQVGQVLTQFLQKPGEEQWANAPDKDARAEPTLHPGQRRGKGPSRALCPPATGAGPGAQGMWGGPEVRKARVLPSGIH